MNKKQRKVYDCKRRRALKKEVLSHYGKYGQLMCSWRCCQIADLDCLTLDYTHNDGAVYRLVFGRSSGNLYNFVKRYDYPTGYRTLCGGHQLKREVARRKVG